MLVEDVPGDQAHREHDAQRCQHEVVQVSQDGDRVGDQVYRAEGLAHHARREDSRVPRDPRVLYAR